MADVANNEQRLTSKGRATRARILDVAADLILEHGIAETQIDDVRRAAGVSGSQVTHYFRDKRTLIQEVIARQAQSVIDDHTAPELGMLDSIDSLRLWAHLVVENQKSRGCQGGCQFGSLAGQLVESDAETRADLAQGFERWLSLFRNGLVSMRDRGLLRAEADTDALAHVLLCAMQGGMLLTQTLRRIEPLRDALDGALTHVDSFRTRNTGP